MDKKRKIGRNDPCPCGSGKKYKNCCGATAKNQVQANKDMIDTLKLNKEIAYKGRIGRQRKDFCVNYIKHKQKTFKEIEIEQNERVADSGATITCQKGCSFCCVENVQASLQECEAIVYYLYQYGTIFRAFLQEYPQWHAKVHKHVDIIEKLHQLFNGMVESGFSEESRQAYAEGGGIYARLNIPCPFLKDNMCLIYEVRPWVCASLVATTPAEWCNPTNPNWEERRIMTWLPGHALELPFYYGHSELSIESVTMPPMVYQILNGGVLYLSTLEGLENLKAEVASDPEVKAIIQKYS